MLKGVAGVANIADDLIIYRNCVKEHDRRVYPAQEKIADIQDTRTCQDVSGIRSLLLLLLLYFCRLKTLLLKMVACYSRFVPATKCCCDNV